MLASESHDSDKDSVPEGELTKLSQKTLKELLSSIYSPLLFSLFFLPLFFVSSLRCAPFARFLYPFRRPAAWNVDITILDHEVDTQRWWSGGWEATRVPGEFTNGRSH